MSGCHNSRNVNKKKSENYQQIRKMDSTNQNTLLKMVDFNENHSAVWNGSYMGESSPWNFTKTNLEDIAMDANFAWLIFSLLVAMIWFTYVTHYGSRVFGQILTKIINRFVGDGYIRIGIGIIILLSRLIYNLLKKEW